jgi:hypothetical protein
MQVTNKFKQYLKHNNISYKKPLVELLKRQIQGSPMIQTSLFQLLAMKLTIYW